MDHAESRPIRLLALIVVALTAANWLSVNDFSQQKPVAPMSERWVDVNHASPADLQLIPGIGPSIARRICQQRGVSFFENADDFETRVKGVGPSFMMNYGRWLRYGKLDDARPVQVSSVEQVASP